MMQDKPDRTPGNITGRSELDSRQEPTDDSHFDAECVLGLMTLVGSLPRVGRIDLL
jgi:hypothetical protein